MIKIGAQILQSPSGMHIVDTFAAKRVIIV